MRLCGAGWISLRTCGGLTARCARGSGTTTQTTQAIRAARAGNADAARAGSRDDGGRDRCGGCWRSSIGFCWTSCSSCGIGRRDASDATARGEGNNKCLCIDLNTAPTPALPARGEGAAVPPPCTGEIRRGAYRKLTANTPITAPAPPSARTEAPPRSLNTATATVVA